MERIVLDDKWVYRKGFLDSIGMLDADPGVEVNLPHDGMILEDVRADAPANVDSGFYPGVTCNYTKYVHIPKEWERSSIGLLFDGAMMHTTIDVNGCKVGEHHYGYSPFYVDITGYISYGEENRITINLNTGVQPSCRWYTGAGLFRGVTLCHGPAVHILTDGVYLWTKEVDDNVAYVEAEIDVANETCENRLVQVEVELVPETSEALEASDVSETLQGSGTSKAAKVARIIQVNPRSRETAKLQLILENPMLWDVDSPNLYRANVSATVVGEYRTHLLKEEKQTCDKADTLFGIRTISVDPRRGLRINGNTVKLKGGCLHHDNGLLGAVSLYESEARKVRKLKEIGFNAIRTAHNPPSAALVEACDRMGMYIFDEAFDAWGMAKRPGDFSQYFSLLWKQELANFVRRDRVHPSVIIWSTGNEIPERGGLDNGYTLATELATAVRKLDGTRPVSNGICSFWSGLDDALARGQSQTQNVQDESEKISWERLTEPFTNGLDAVGYNYMEDLYLRDHEMFPERVILGSENFPKEIGFRWPMVEALPYVIGDFTWTAWDYIGEAGIGKTAFVDRETGAKMKPWDLMPQGTSPYPWRLANDADVDITGCLCPQGAYRSVVFGSEKTHLYATRPEHYGKTEIVSMWGFPDLEKNWTFPGFEGKRIELSVFSCADEVELFLDGVSVGRKKVEPDPAEFKPIEGDAPMPRSVRFVVSYQPGVVEAVSYRAGKEISRDRLETCGEPAKMVLLPEKTVLRADGHDLIYVNIEVQDEEGRVVPGIATALEATVNGAGILAGFGSANPITEDNYSHPSTTSYRGRAQAIIRGGYEPGEIHLCVKAPLLELEAACSVSCVGRM